METKWKMRWGNLLARHEKTRANAPTYYSLAMFPYPSGALHLGHVRVYSLSDCIARYQYLRGKRILHPMGWDAFGLPAENAARERHRNPLEWTQQNIQEMRKQLVNLGFFFQWDKEINTCAVNYYQWTQQLFLLFYQSGLVVQKEGWVNWDPIDRTVLANEQVNPEGKSWRSNAPIQKKRLKQWYFKISDYSEQLLADIDKLEKWPEPVKNMQRQWIGKSKGHLIHFSRVTSSNLPLKTKELLPTFSAFTTHIETIFGVTYLGIASDSSYINSILNILPLEKKKAVNEFLHKYNAMTQKLQHDASAGIDTGIRVIHPATRKQIPVYIADYVLSEYGTGCVMGVPGHDKRDHQFAVCHSLPIVSVFSNPSNPMDEPQLINSPPYNDMNIPQAVQRLEKQAYIEKTKVYRLRDWLVSRQRLWGTPVPMIHCAECGIVPVPEKDLPVQLPSLDDWNAFESPKGECPETETISSPLQQAKDWMHCECPKCGGKAQRDCDTLDTFVDSSWYFLRYWDPQNSHQPFNPKVIEQWLSQRSPSSISPQKIDVPKSNITFGIDSYVGGIEHAVLHLLYARFFTKVLYDAGKIPFNEPFQELIAQGMVLGETYKTKEGQYINQATSTVSDATNGQKECQKSDENNANDKIQIVWEKMSKSKYNGISPESMQEKYTSDVLRLGILFKAPPTQDLEWKEDELIGHVRWLKRIWKLVEYTKTKGGEKAEGEGGEIPKRGEGINEKERKEMAEKLKECIYEVTQAIESSHAINVGIATLQKYTNYLQSVQEKGGIFTHSKRESETEKLWKESMACFSILLAPFAPHMAYEIMETLQMDYANVQWPQIATIEENFIFANVQEKPIQIILQENGRMRRIEYVQAKDVKKLISIKHDLVALLQKNKGIQQYIEKKKLDVHKVKVILPKGKGSVSCEGASKKEYKNDKQRIILNFIM